MVWTESGQTMGFAVLSKGLVPSIVRDNMDSARSLSLLRSPISSSLPFSKSKSRTRISITPLSERFLLSLQSSSCLVKHCVSACSSDKGLNEDYAPSGESNSSKEISINMKHPRRSMIVQFTCNSCGERTQRRINRVAYERGTVFIQCAGCLVNHKLVDNLGLMVDYDLREKLDADFDGTL